MKSPPRVEPARWLLLVFQLPPKPAYLRVKLWRRLQSIGAISLKNAVYVLPANEETLEDFQWVLREVGESGGDGVVCEAGIVDGMRDDEVRALFDAARDADYAELAKDLRALVPKPKPKRGKAPADMKSQLARARQRFEALGRVDFFGATGRLKVEALLGEFEQGAAMPAKLAAAKPANWKARTWVTRRGVYVDRVACAWLIRRFIDPQARFKFVAEKGYAPKPGELRFDMFKGEFTHEGDRCSFEVLLERLRIDDPALRIIGEIVHDIDLKDGKFAHEETAGIAHVIASICGSQSDDEQRIARASAVLDDSYERFRKLRNR